jgi:hypothetical protein
MTLAQTGGYAYLVLQGQQKEAELMQQRHVISKKRRAGGSQAQLKLVCRILRCGAHAGPG